MEILKNFLKSDAFLVALAVGIPSGVTVGSLEGDFLWYGGGAVFGFFSGLYFFLYSEKFRLLKFIPWIIASDASFYSAVWVYLHTPDYVLRGFGTAASGFVGVSIVLVAFHLLVSRLSWRIAIFLLVVGTLIPVPFLWSGTGKYLYPLFIVWQTAALAIFGYALFLKKTEK